ncbi:hypothetical protein NDU88_004970 [Pleurodeles waltl]|uniref:Uncharacterized protein n=1 Tax=Pleurodeles waltl TaxID=8319 RepID=A0AAV7MUY6_PLEWA|nr:hypothetical protein NDU88_004970 [Pleurodeles waltl]
MLFLSSPAVSKENVCVSVVTSFVGLMLFVCDEAVGKVLAQKRIRRHFLREYGPALDSSRSSAVALFTCSGLPEPDAGSSPCERSWQDPGIQLEVPHFNQRMRWDTSRLPDPQGIVLLTWSCRIAARSARIR